MYPHKTSSRKTELIVRRIHEEEEEEELKRCRQIISRMKAVVFSQRNISMDVKNSLIEL